MNIILSSKECDSQTRGVLLISSDRDDQLVATIKTQNNL